MMANPEHGFVGFEYLEVSAKRSMESMYVDGYRNFGWKFEDASAQEAGSGAVRLKFKRDRRIPSKAELTRLQRQFEACVLEIEALERSKTTAAAIAAFTIGLAGTAFLGRTEQVSPIIEQKNDEICSVCEQGCRLLTA